MPTWKYLMFSLYSNQTIIDGRKRPWYWATIFFILAAVLIVIPILSRGFTDSGTSIINPSSDLAVGEGLYRLSQEDSFDDLFIGEVDGKLTLQSSDNDSHSFVNSVFYAKTSIDTREPVGNAAVATEISYSKVIAVVDPDGFTAGTDVTTDDSVTVDILRVYSTNIDSYTEAGITEISNLVNNKIARTDVTDTSVAPAQRSFLLVSPRQFWIYAYPPLGTTGTDSNGTVVPTAAVAASPSAQFTGTFEAFADALDADGRFSFAQLKVTGSLTTGTDEATNEFLGKWNPFLSRSYLTLRNKNTWIQFGIVGGSSLAAMVLAGFAIWLVTLGRRNLLHGNCTLWQGLKMAGTLAFSCALIGMVVSFFNLTTGLMFGAMALIMRTMMLVMKTTPTGVSGAGQSKPLYQARD